jgi:proteic killer suppression protein
VIESFRHKCLQELFERGSTRRVQSALQERATRRLDALHAAAKVSDLGIPGFNLHPLQGRRPPRYSIHVNGPWCITFEWNRRAGNAAQVDLEQYH